MSGHVPASTNCQPKIVSMKKLIPSLAIAFAALASCHHHHGLRIAYNDDGGFYSMNAWFDREQTRSVDEYIRQFLGERRNNSFVSSHIDRRIAFDDGTKIYIMKKPGRLCIQLDKDENSYESYEAVKVICEGLRDVLR